MYDLKPVIETSSFTLLAILFVVTAAVVLVASPSDPPAPATAVST